MELLADVGFEVELAENGKIAVEMAAEKPFDAVLMDMQMPEMDGVAATREIRKSLGPEDLPIIAMTANAMAADRDRCIEAGMNDHVAKPIDPVALFATLLKWIRPREAASSQSPVPGPQSPVPSPQTTAPESRPTPSVPDGQGALEAIEGLDMKGGLSRVLNKRDLYERLLRQFTTGPESQTIDTVRTQLAEGDPKAAERAAHSLKGVAGTLGAGELQQRAAGLEAAIKEEKPKDEIEKHLETVNEELTRFITALQEALPPEEAAEVADAEDVDWEKAREILSQLEEQLAGDDAAAIDLFEESAPLLRAALGDAAASVEEPLSSWDFGTALAALREAREGG